MYNQRVLLNPIGGGPASSSDGTYAVGDILYASTVHVLSRLPIGSEGEVLTVTSGLPAWEASSGGTASPLTTKGDIYTYSTDNARLPVGSNGQVLTADSAETTGLKWTTVSGTGTVVGPSGSTDNAVVRFDGTGGTSIQNSGVIIDDSNNITGAVGLNLSGLTASRVVVTDASKNLSSSSVTTTTLAFLDATSSVQTQLDGKQALDSDLTALAGLSSTGVIVRTGSGTAAVRTITGTTNQVNVSNGDGVSGNPTLSTPQDIHSGASPTFSGTTLSGLTASTVLVANGSKAITSSSVTTTTLGFLDATSSIQSQLDGKQPLDSDLSALAALSSTGLIARTGSGTVAGRTITGTTNQVNVANGDGVSANPTLSLPQDIHTGASPTFTGQTLSGLTASRVLIANASKAITASSISDTTLGFLDATSSIQTQIDGKQPLDSDLTAIAGLSSTGVVVRTGSGTATTRTITGTANQITVTNGDGVSANPTLSTPQDIHTAATPTFAGLTINNAGSLVLKELAASGTDSVSIHAPNNLGASYTLVLPSDDGSSGEVLTTDGSGNLSWSVVSGGGGSGGGDVTGQSSSVDSEIVLFSGTGGKTIKRATGTGVVHSTSGVYSVANVNLASEVTGVLPIANGGTNSSTSLNNNRIMQSVSGAIVEASGITSGRVLISDANGIPTHSSVTTTTLGYLDATSSIQTQIDGKVAKAGDTMTGNLIMDNEKEIRFREASGSGTNYAAIKAPATLAADYTLTLPVDDGSANQFLKTDGSGVLSWANPAGSGDVVGPSGATDNAVVRFNGTSGTSIQNSGVIIDDDDILTAAGIVVDEQRIISQFEKNYVRNNSGASGTTGWTYTGAGTLSVITSGNLPEPSLGTAIEVIFAVTNDTLEYTFTKDASDSLVDPTTGLPTLTRFVLRFAYNTKTATDSSFWNVEVEGDDSGVHALEKVPGSQTSGIGLEGYYQQFVNLTMDDSTVTIRFTASSAEDSAGIRLSSVFFGPAPYAGTSYLAAGATSTSGNLAVYSNTKGGLKDSVIIESSGSLLLGTIAGPGSTYVRYHNSGSFDFSLRAPDGSSNLGVDIYLPWDDGWLVSFNGASITPVDNEIPRWDGTVGRIQNSSVTIDDSQNVAGVAQLSANKVVTNLLQFAGTTPTVGKAIVATDTSGNADWATIADVYGPSSAGNNNVVLFDGTSGKLIKDSGLTVPAAFGDVVGPAGATADNLASYDSATGKLIKDSGIASATVGVGPGTSVAGNIVSFTNTDGRTLADSGVAAASVVVGPAGATANAPAIWDGASGKLLKDGPTPAADGTYSPVTSITIVNGIITAIS